MNSVPRFLDYSPKPINLGDEGRRFPRHHIFEEKDVHAVNAALASGRPLLLKGRHGTGKSQLALAAAVGLDRAFVSQVIDARLESRDLLWRFDAVRRLADAQASSASRLEQRRAQAAEGEDLLDESFYTAPGPLWWAFNWQRASTQAAKAGVSAPGLRPGCSPKNGVVVLLDEIDKADSSVPNGLLGVLGDGEFVVPGVATVSCGEVEPLVVITTNEERSLPPAFLRRCAVHHLKLASDRNELRRWLLRLGEAHHSDLGADTLKEAAKMVLDDREFCLREDLNPPGGAEYLDLLRVVAERSKTPQDVAGHLESARQFLVRKHPLREDLEGTVDAVADQQ